MAIRGDSWRLDLGSRQTARNIDSDTWELTIVRLPDNKNFEFKALTNDTTWSTTQL